jgi:hypothetical protein
MKCKTCGKNSDNDYCFQHKPKKSLKQNKLIPTITPKKGVVDGKYLQRDMFLNIWKKRPHRSEISGVYLGSEPMSTYFHHILPKSKYPEACFDEENIILLSLDEHINVEADIYKYEEVNKRREQLKIKYNL